LVDIFRIDGNGLIGVLDVELHVPRGPVCLFGEFFLERGVLKLEVVASFLATEQRDHGVVVAGGIANASGPERDEFGDPADRERRACQPALFERKEQAGEQDVGVGAELDVVEVEMSGGSRLPRKLADGRLLGPVVRRDVPVGMPVAVGLQKPVELVARVVPVGQLGLDEPEKLAVLFQGSVGQVGG